MIIIDLDGTLCDARHREHLAKAGQWEEFHSLHVQDDVFRDVWWLIKMADVTEDQFCILTGRNEKWRNSTIVWLQRFDIFPLRIAMRPDNDFSPDKELKPRLLESVLYPSRAQAQSDVDFILEDRDVMVETWRGLGYNCWQVRPGGY